MFQKITIFSKKDDRITIPKPSDRESELHKLVVGNTGQGKASHKIIHILEDKKNTPLYSTTGSGMSMSVKRKILNDIHKADDQEIIILDPESEHINL